MATLGELIINDDGSVIRGRKSVKLPEKGMVRAGAGKWQQTSDGAAWRSTWTKEMGHTPVMSYNGFNGNDLVVEVTFRFGEVSEDWQSQCFRIALDRRPDVTGHILSAWANLNNDFIESGFLLQHIRKTPKKVIIEDLLLDHQPVSMTANQWYTATVESVGDEALFRMGDHIAYAKSESISAKKNLVSLTTGKTWHEVKSVRIWRATLNPLWAERKEALLKKRKPFEPISHNYQPAN